MKWCFPDACDVLTNQIFGEDVRTDQLESRVFSDISMTLHLFNYTLPSILRGSFAFVRQVHNGVVAVNPMKYVMRRHGGHLM